MDPQVAVATALDCLRHDVSNFLGQHTDISLIGPIVGEPVKPQTAVETAEKDNVVLERNIRPASAAPTSASNSTAARCMEAVASAVTTSCARSAMRLSVGHFARGSASG